MRQFKEYWILVILLFVIVFNFGCKGGNHIDKYEVSVDSLKTLPDGFYAFRRGNIYYSNENYMIWYGLDNSGKVEHIIKVSDLKDQNSGKSATILKYNVDTAGNRSMMQRFVGLSRKFKFGHLKVDKSNKISFSNRDGLAEQFVMTFNGDLKYHYSKNRDYMLLTNGWFEYVGK